MREQSRTEASHEDPIDDVAQEHLQFKRGPFERILSILTVDFLIDATDGVAVSHLELGKLLVFYVEPIFEVRDRLAFLTVLDLGEDSLHFDYHVTLHLFQDL